MALTVTKEGQLGPSTAGLRIYGKPLDWHAVRAEHKRLKARDMLPYQRKASIFIQTEGTLQHEIQAYADDTRVHLFPPANCYIGLQAKHFRNPHGLSLIEFIATLKYPETAGPLLHRTRYKGMPTFREITPTIVKYFEDLHGTVDGTWAKFENDPRSDNFQAMDHAIKQGKSPTEAVRATPVWNTFQLVGFTEIALPTLKDGNWIVEVYRPGTTLRRQPFS